MTKREYYSDSIDGFLNTTSDEILGKLAEEVILIWVKPNGMPG